MISTTTIVSTISTTTALGFSIFFSSGTAPYPLTMVKQAEQAAVYPNTFKWMAYDHDVLRKEVVLHADGRITYRGGFKSDGEALRFVLELQRSINKKNWGAP